MNLMRSLSSHQKYYLEQICLGKRTAYWSAEERRYVCCEWVNSTGERYYSFVPHNKPRPKYVTPYYPAKAALGRWAITQRDWFGSAVVELLQRGLLKDVNGRLMPTKEAVKVFGSPPPPPAPKRTVKMSRTRPARDQSDGEVHVERRRLRSEDEVAVVRPLP